MAAITGPKDVARLGDSTLRDFDDVPVAASTTIHAGALLALDANGYATNAATSTTQKALGLAEESVANTGANGAKNVRVRFGTFKFVNSSAGDAIVQADCGSLAYIVDNQTVAKTNGSSTRSIAGRVMRVDSDGVWVRVYLGQQ